jgi:hypothetical protein
MSKDKKKTDKGKKARTKAVQPIVWPPEEWPEEVRKPYIEATKAAWNDLFAEIFASAFPPPKSAEIIPFPRPKKARDSGDGNE